jgi:hypothetical protein
VNESVRFPPAETITRLSAEQYFAGYIGGHSNEHGALELPCFWEIRGFLFQSTSSRKDHNYYKLCGLLQNMTITLTEEDQKEIADRTMKDPKILLSFLEWYDRYKNQKKDDRTACQLALRKKTEIQQEIYLQKQAEYLDEVREDYQVRLISKKKWQTGPTFSTKSGFRVRSKIEKIIADFLFGRGIRFVYEPIVNLGGFYVMPDFYLMDYEVFVEHFGLENQAYKASAESKLARFRRFKIRVICTYPADEPDIEAVLTAKLLEVGIAV